MKYFEEAIETACAKEEIPGAVLLASDKHGNFNYGKAFGKRSVREGADQSPLQLDSVMWMASCTKVVTSLAALQCCERGLLRLDEPIYDVLPELRDLPVIRGFDDEKDGGRRPLLSPHKRPITLRHLLTHSSGLAYDDTHPKLLAWHEWHRTRPNRANVVEARYAYPLVFEPGESWCYGAGVDWAGVAVERANQGTTTLQRYCEENIFRVAGARDVVFSSHLHTRPDLRARMADMSKRDADGKVMRSNARKQENERGGCFGGLGLYATPVDYFRILRGILQDELLLGAEYANEFFRPCLGDGAKVALNRLLLVEEARVGMGNLPVSVQKNWALGGIVNEDCVPGGREAGSMTWTGLPNLLWFVDRRSGLCGLYAGQLYPPGDAKVGELCDLFEQGVYEMYSKSNSPRL